MNYNINDQSFVNSELYQNFLRENPGTGNLRIRAYAASQAVPVSGVKALVTKNIEGNNVVFFEGYTDASGIIERISLPTPRLSSDNMNEPNKATYELLITYEPDNIRQIYSINMYENICAVQNINIAPSLVEGDSSGR